MIIHIEGFDKLNNYILKKINTHSLMIKDLTKWSCYDWYKDGIQLSPYYKDWIENDTYEIIFNNEYINLYIQYNNKIIITPLINKKSTIKNIKDILSIKDNIYFGNIRLKDDKTLEFYNINNMDKLYISYAVATVDC
jgi:hypothetical protein